MVVSHAACPETHSCSPVFAAKIQRSSPTLRGEENELQVEIMIDHVVTKTAGDWFSGPGVPNWITPRFRCLLNGENVIPFRTCLNIEERRK